MAEKKSSEPDYIRTRICLVTPQSYDPNTFAKTLSKVLAAGDVASLIITAPSGTYEDEDSLLAGANALVPIAQEADVATLIHNSTQVMGRSDADGVHLDGPITELVEAAEKFAGKRIIGAAGITTRHDAMLIGEGPIDYLFFGRLNGDTLSDIFKKTHKLGAWWASMFEVPAIVMGGNSIDSASIAQDANIEFIALKDAIWNSENPSEALIQANKIIDDTFASLTS